MKSLTGIELVLKNYADASIHLNRFGCETNDRFSELATKDESYPLMYVIYDDGDIDRLVVQIKIVSKINEDRSNINYIRSSCRAIFNDLYAYFNRAESTYSLTNIPYPTVIDDTTYDYLAGYEATYEFLADQISDCKLPLLYTPSENNCNIISDYLPPYLTPEQLDNSEVIITMQEQINTLNEQIITLQNIINNL